MWKYHPLFVKIVLVVNGGGCEVTGYLLGILGFICFYIFDVFSMHNRKRLKYVFLLFGLTMLGVGSVLAFGGEPSFSLHVGVRILFAILTILFLFLLYYSVVMEVGKNTYQYNNVPKLVTSGTYALSRHPGVLWLFGFYFALGLTFESIGLLIASFVFTVVNVVYVYLQERFIFIHIFKEYPTYQQHTPFILPNRKSFRTFIDNIQMEERNT